jgi:outer membrane biosynthesis protein TonB
MKTPARVVIIVCIVLAALNVHLAIFYYAWPLLTKESPVESQTSKAQNKTPKQVVTASPSRKKKHVSKAVVTSPPGTNKQIPAIKEAPEEPKDEMTPESDKPEEPPTSKPKSNEESQKAKPIEAETDAITKLENLLAAKPAKDAALDSKRSNPNAILTPKDLVGRSYEDILEKVGKPSFTAYAPDYKSMRIWYSNKPMILNGYSIVLESKNRVWTCTKVIIDK